MPECITTQTALGDSVGLSQSQVSRRLRERDCPVSESGPWDSDDVETLREWLAGPGGMDADIRLKRSQSIKAQTLSAKYTLAMLTEIGQLGGDLFSEFGRALEQATLIHFRNTQYRLGDVFREKGNMNPVDADRYAELFAREYVEGFANEVAKAFRFHNKTSETLAPVVVHAERVAKDLRELGDLPAAMLDRLDNKLEEVQDILTNEPTEGDDHEDHE